ncbi:MAG: DUF2971 domain-containing protein [Pseudobutyrivibrio ruminis]|nr:DUF2971 domain-containing protein [Pseudobutyrivibrio ruminis]MBE6025256.1 DUF2971 domain-containing protein [Cellulosilyticum sp.]
MEKDGMYYINKEDIESYRFAIAKIAFLETQDDFKLVQDIPKSNCLECFYKQDNKVIVSLFREPTIKVDKNKKAFYFYQKTHVKRAVAKYEGHNRIHIEEFSPVFDEKYNIYFEQAISSPKAFMENKQYLEFLDGILLKREDIEENDEKKWYKYYSKESIISNKHGLVDGTISFSNPNKFNDPFDVNCSFANSQDISDLFRIFCVAPSPEEILLWSYYSSDHKGYCFEYRHKDIMEAVLASITDGLFIIGNVTYSNYRPKQKSKLNRISFSEVKFYIEAAFTKFEEWSHEKEFRFVLLSQNFKDADDYISYKVDVVNIYKGIKGDGTLIKDGKGNIITPKPISKDSSKYLLHS